MLDGGGTAFLAPGVPGFTAHQCLAKGRFGSDDGDFAPEMVEFEAAVFWPDEKPRTRAVHFEFDERGQVHGVAGHEVFYGQRFVAGDGVLDFAGLAGLGAGEIGGFEAAGVVFAFGLAAFVGGLGAGGARGSVNRLQIFREAGDNALEQIGLLQFTPGHGQEDLRRRSVQIEEEDLGRFAAGEGEGLLVADGRAVAGLEFELAELDAAGGDLHPGVAAGFEFVGGLVAGIEFADEELHVLIDLERAVPAVMRDHADEFAGLKLLREGFLFVTGRQGFFLGQNPDLQEMDRLGFRVVELAVLDAGAGGHALDFAGFHDRAVAHAVAMFERARQDDRDDFHVAMRVHAETAAARDDVVIDDAKGAEAHVFGVVIIREGKGEMAVEPAVIGVAAVLGFAQGNHNWFPVLVAELIATKRLFHKSRSAQAVLYRPGADNYSRGMSQPHYRVRRATVDDREILRSLWLGLNLPPDELERRLTEFQVAISETGELCGGVGLEIAGRQARVHSEVFADFALAEGMRGKLWERLQALGLSHGVARYWTQETAPFWKQRGFAVPDEAALKKLPATWAALEAPWRTLQCRDEEAIEQTLEQQFALLRAEEQERTKKLFRHGRLLNWIATLLAIGLALFVGVYSLKLLQSHGLHH